METAQRTFADEPIVGDGFVLRAPSMADVTDIVASCTDELTQTFLPMPRPYTQDVGRNFVTKMVPEQYRSGAGIVRAIEVDGRLHGMIDLKKTDWRACVTEIGYWVSPWGRGAGLAGRASRVLADWALRDQGMERVAIHAATGNIPSQKAALAAGFVREGVARSAGFVHAGRVDLVVFSRIRSDLAGSRNGLA